MAKQVRTLKSFKKLSCSLPGPKKELISLLKCPEVESWRALMAAFQGVFHRLERALVAEGCSVSRFQILFFLYFEGELPAVEMARKLIVTRGNMTMFLRRMESDGLIRSFAPPGRKRPLFILTKKGRVFFEKIFPGHIRRVRKLISPFRPSVQKDLLKIKR